MPAVTRAAGKNFLAVRAKTGTIGSRSFPAPPSGSRVTGEYFVIELEAALRRMGGDRELLGMLVSMFLEDAPRLVQSIETSVSGAQWAEVHQAAHCLRGLAANLDATGVIQAAGQLEEQTADGPPAQPQTALESLQVAVQRVLAELRQVDLG